MLYSLALEKMNGRDLCVSGVGLEWDFGVASTRRATHLFPTANNKEEKTPLTFKSEESWLQRLKRNHPYLNNPLSAGEEREGLNVAWLAPRRRATIKHELAPSSPNHESPIPMKQEPEGE